MDQKIFGGIRLIMKTDLDVMGKKGDIMKSIF